jgi:hypothetical protein
VPVLGRTRAPWASNRARTIARDLPAAWRGPDCLPSWRMARAAAVPGGQRAMGEAGGRQLSGNLAAGADSWRPERDTCRSGRLRVRGSRVVFPWEHDGGLKRLDAGRNGSIRAEAVGVCAGRRITAGQGVEWGPLCGGSGRRLVRVFESVRNGAMACDNRFQLRSPRRGPAPMPSGAGPLCRPLRTLNRRSRRARAAVGRAA